MSKKEKTISIEAVRKMLEKNKNSKVYELAESGKLSLEAVKFLLKEGDSEVDTSIFYAIKDRGEYSYSNIFDSFEDYTKSNLFNSLTDRIENADYLYWIERINETPEEIYKLFTEADYQTKKGIYKTFLSRKRVLGMRKGLQEDYSKYIEIIFKMTREMEQYDSEHEDALNEYVVKWLYFIDKKALDFLKTRIDSKELADLLHTRFIYKCGYGYGMDECLLDELDITIPILTLFDLIDNEDLLPKLNPTRVKQRKDSNAEIVFEKMKSLYNKYASPKLNSKSIIDSNAGELGGISTTSALAIIAFEDDEDKKDFAFFNAVSECGWSAFMNFFVDRLCALSREGIDVRNIKITKEMEDFSIMNSKDLSYVLLREDIDSTEKVKTLHKILNRKNHLEGRGEKKLGMYSGNTLTQKRLGLHRFSQEQIDDIAYTLNWNECERYFEGGRMPVDFIIDNHYRLGNYSICCGLRGNSVEDIILVLEKIGKKLSKELMDEIIENIFANEKSNRSKDNAAITNEQIAKLLSFIEDEQHTISLWHFKLQGEKFKDISLQKVISLL